MTELARHKLNEAQFFFRKLKRSEGNELDYHLSATLSATRAVTEFLQGEYSGQNAFDKWYEDKLEIMDQDPLFSYMNELRVRFVHPRGEFPQTEKDVTTASFDETLDDIPDHLKSHPRVDSVSTTGVSISRWVMRNQSHEIYDELGKGVDIETMLEVYLTRLDRIVHEWEEHLGHIESQEENG